MRYIWKKAGFMFRRICSGIFAFSLLISVNCDDDEFVPKGECRLKKIIYEGQGEIVFKYNDDGLLAEHNLPYGPTYRAIFEYDASGRLIRRAELAGDPEQVQRDIVFKYLTPLALEGTLTSYQSGQPSSTSKVFFYYNTNLQLDSTRVVQATTEINAEFKYIDGNLESSEQITTPCCNTLTIGKATYDDKINPFYLLKKNANHLGMESFDRFDPAGIFIASINNDLSFEVLDVYRVSENDPRISKSETKVYEHDFEYYPNSQYVKRRTTTQSSTGLRFEYEACR